MAPVIRERPIVKKVEKKKSVVLQCAVQGTQDIDVQWFKEGQAISAGKTSRYSVEKKKSEVRDGETIVQLQIEDTEINDQGSYQLVAKSETGETQSQTVTLQEDQVKMEAAEGTAETESVTATEEVTTKKKKKKKVVKKKKKEKEVIKPEVSSYLKNFVSLISSLFRAITDLLRFRSRKKARVWSSSAAWRRTTRRARSR